MPSLRVRLRQRPPNPAPSFSGRAREEAALVELLSRSPVAVIGGPQGIGKTELLLHALHGALGDAKGRAIFVAVPAGEAAGQLVRDLVSALSEALGRRIDEDLLREPDDVLIESALDLAEQGALVVILDGADGAKDAGALLVTMATYARASRWIATARRPLHPHLGAVTLELGPLDGESLMAAGKRHRPGAEPATLARAARSSGGSPWLFFHLLDTDAASAAEAREQLRQSLSEAAAELARVLSALTFEVPIAALTRALGPVDVALGELSHRGLVARSASAVRVRDTVAELLFGERPTLTAELRRTFADALLGGDPESILDALALLRGDHGDGERFSELLAAEGGTLVQYGLAPRLFRLLVDVPGDVAGRWRVRCAAELGNPTALAGVAEGHAHRLDQLGSDEDRLAWALTKYAHGDITSAEQLALAVQAGASGTLALRASLLVARCARHRGGRAELAAPTGDAELDAEREAMLLAMRGASTGVERELDALAVRAARFPDALLELIDVHLSAGRWDAAAALLGQVMTRPRGADDALLTARRARLAACRVALAQGRLDDAVRAIEAVKPFVRATSLLRGALLSREAELRLLAGPLGDAEALLESAREEATRTRDVATASEVGSLRARLSIANAEPIAGTGAYEQVRRARWGEPVDAGGTDAPSLVAAAHAALHAGASTEARERAAQAVRAAERGSASDALEALATAADVACATSATDREPWVTRLLDRAARLGSPRFIAEAELMVALLAERPAPATLERIAGQDRSGVAARRARAILGAAVPLDRTDERVIAAARDTLAITPRGAAWSPGWGLDGRTSSVWLEDGRAISLVSRPLLWTVLSILATRAEASKEELVVGGWNEAEYHPLRHDARLQMSIRKLRELIEDDPAAPTRLLTVEGGYRLRGPVRCTGG